MGDASARDVDARYWQEYSNLQRVKHDLIRHYLDGWFPKLTSWAGKVLYIDTHAGRGRHITGDLGSPLVALTTFLKRKDRDAILQRSEVRFIFIERSRANIEALQEEIREVGPLPHGVVVVPQKGDAFHVLEETTAGLREAGKRMAPAFIFVDPYGFKVPCSVLRDLMAFKGVEVFVTVIWRELDMGICQSSRRPGMGETVDLVFGGPDWRNRIVGRTPDDRANDAVELLREQIGAKWGTYIRMLGDNTRTRYVLLHLTNHDKGRDLMKEAMWKSCPDGGFYARKSEDPRQEILISPQVDLAPVRRWVISELRKGPKRWGDIHRLVRAELWIEKHVNEAVRGLRHEGRLVVGPYEGRFGPTANPLLSVAPDDSD